MQCEICGRYDESVQSFVIEDYIASGHYTQTIRLCPRCETEYYDECLLCYECGGVYFRDDMVYDVCGLHLCEGCYEDYYITCRECGKFAHLNEAVDGYCERCYNDIREVDIEEQRENIEYWDDFGTFEFFQHYKGRPAAKYYGIELECGVFRDDIDNVCEFNNILAEIPYDYFYTQPDMSIYDNCDVSFGVEIVSQPATFEWLKANQDKWQQIFDLADYGLRSYDTDSCGMHIHISRKAFRTKIHLYRFMRAVYLWPKFTELISERTSGQLRYWAKLDSDSAEIRAKVYDGETHSRYTAVNTRNVETIEIRIFRGTLLPESFWKNVEYVEALYQFTKKRGVTLPKFLLFIKEHKDRYENLYYWLWRQPERLLKLVEPNVVEEFREKPVSKRQIVSSGVAACGLTSQG